MKFAPELLKFANGTDVTAETWEARRREMLDILAREEYGFYPPMPKKVEGIVKNVEEKHCSGHADMREIEIRFDTPKGDFGFPLRLVCPNDGKKHPLFVFINFRPDLYDLYLPLEEVIDHGFAVADIYYQDITADDGDFTSGLAAMYDRPADGTGFGKISLWAFAMSRAIDYLVTLPEIDKDNLAVIGHSRLGKTALWCGANDTRAKFVISNDSGCGGAAYERIKHPGSETIEVMNRVFPFWFCENRGKYVNKSGEMPFDQHFLLAASAPRFVLAGSAEKDDWADQYSEQLSCVALTPVYRLLGKQGFVGPEEPAKVGDDFGEGDVAYHLRSGVHYLGRTDWLSYMRFIEARL